MIGVCMYVSMNRVYMFANTSVFASSSTIFACASCNSRNKSNTCAPASVSSSCVQHDGTSYRTKSE